MKLEIDADILLTEVPVLRVNEYLKLDFEQFGQALNLEVQGYGPRMSASAPPTTTSPFKDYWNAVKSEIYAFMCTKSRKYASLRSQIAKKGGPATAYVLAAISASVAATLGATVGMLTPLVGWILLSIARVGVNAWCAVNKPSL